MTVQFTKQYADVGGARLAYVDEGAGPPLVFLHGNPTSSYLWRNMVGPLSTKYRCLAPDLVGMGDSDKLAGTGDARYSFHAHQRYLDAWFEQLNLGEPVALIVHDWGSALGFDWVRRFPGRVRGVAYMEAIVGVRPWEELPEPAQQMFRALRSAAGEELVLERNAFVEELLPRSILRRLTAAEHAEYRRPFQHAGEARRPTLAWPRQLPMGGEPPDICELVERYAGFMAQSHVPKLFINAEPGRLLVGSLREACRRWPNQTEVTVKGLHYVQEDSPVEITAALSSWLEMLP